MQNIPNLSFTIQYAAITRELISKVKISKAFDPQKTNPKNVQQHEFNAIWDTGATGSVITKKVAEKCSIEPIRMAEVHHAKGKSRTNVYLVNIFLPNKVLVPMLSVTEGDLSGKVDVLIGMDIISIGDFAVSNCGGRTTFTFRMPSRERFDFVINPFKEKPHEASPKVGRNELCPCGSGKKYKNCCIDKDRGQRV